MIDIGVNLLNAQFDEDRPQVVARARQAGVEPLVISTDLAMSKAALACARSLDLYATAGVHPHDAKDAPADLLDRLLTLARDPRIVAIGETGLDFNRNFSPPDVQRRVFARQLEAAAEAALPVFVHDRDSAGEVASMLAGRSTGVDAVVHCFTGTRAELEAHLTNDCHIGITGWLCDPKRGVELAELVPLIPPERLLVETDAPFLLPKLGLPSWPPADVARRHKRRNEPMLLKLVVARLAALRDEDPATLAATAAANARRLFRLPGDKALKGFP